MELRKRLVVATFAVMVTFVAIGPVTAAAEPVRPTEGYGFRLDPLTTKIFASDPARALGEIAQSRPLSAPYAFEAQDFWFATQLAQRAARHPQGCVEFHVRGGSEHSTWTGVGTMRNPCPWVVPTMWQEEPTPIGWSRGQG